MILSVAKVGAVPPRTFCHPERSRGICSSLNHQPNLNDSATLPFVIPSEAERSAVLSTTNPILTTAPLSPLSRAKPSDLQFSQPPTQS